MTTRNRPYLSSRNDPRNIAVARSRETLGVWLAISIRKQLAVGGWQLAVFG
jgi:hypothetical protein